MSQTAERARAPSLGRIQDGGRNFRYYISQVYVWTENYLIAAAFTTLTFLVRLLVLVLTLPLICTAAFVGLIDPSVGRIVNVSSGAASMFLKTQDAATKALFSNPNVTMEELEAGMKEKIASGDTGYGKGYGLSKAGLTALTLIQAKAYPNLKVLSLSPGFIDTPMTRGFGAKLTPEQGCVSAIKCLFSEDVTSGYYYGSDGLRSPLTMTRDPGMPEYEGEDNPTQEKYNKSSALG
jgi:hypothetical protein